MAGPFDPFDDSQSVRGSWFGNSPGWRDEMDSGKQASGWRVSDAPGIALPNRSTLGQQFDVTTPDGRTFRGTQTDVGPAKWTGRGVDINSSAAKIMGYSPQNFPTDATFKVKPVGQDMSWDQVPEPQYTSQPASESGQRPIPDPQPTPTPPSGRQNLGPFKNMNDAYESAPADTSGYRLQQTDDGFTWAPKTTDVGFGPNPLYHPQADRTLDQFTFDSPGSNSKIIQGMAYNFGAAFNRDLARMLDLPSNVANLAINGIAAGTGTKPIAHFGTPFTDLANKLSPQVGGGALNTVASFGGGALGAAIPFIGAGLKAASAGVGLGAPILEQAAKAPLKTAANEALIAAGSGSTQGEAHELYQGATGRSGDFGDVASQIIGGSVFNPIRTAAITGVESAASRAWSLGKAAKAGAASTLGTATSTAIDPATGKMIMDNHLKGQLTDALDTAKDHVAALGTASPQDSVAQIAESAGAAKTALQAFAKNSASEERQLWSPEAGVNLQMPRDFSKTQALYQQMKQDHFQDTLRDPASFPSNLEKLLFQGKGEAPILTGLFDQNGQPITRPSQQGLAPVDTLGRGQDLRSRVLQMANDERLAQGRSVDRAKIGYLDRIAGSLKDDMASGEGGANPAEIDAYNRAMAYSGARADIMSHPEVRDILSGRQGDAAALERFVKQGQPGADAARTLIAAANARYGSEGLLGAAKDVMRQKFSDQVAPAGYVSQDAYNRFTKNYGGMLSQPEFADVRGQFEQAQKSEQALSDIPGFGKPNWGTSAGQADQRMNRAELYLNAPTDTVMTHLEGVSNKFEATKRVISDLDQDPSGQAFVGFKHVVADRILGGGKGEGSYPDKHGGILAAIDQKDPGFREAAQKFSSNTTKEGITKSLQDWALSYAGAHFVGDKLGGSMGSSFVMAGRSAAMARQLGQMTMQQLTGISSAVIADPAVRQAWGRFASGQTQSTAERAADLLLLHAYVPGLALSNLPTDQETGKGTPGSPPGPRNETQGPGGQPWWKSLNAPGAGGM